MIVSNGNEFRKIGPAPAPAESAPTRRQAFSEYARMPETNFWQWLQDGTKSKPEAESHRPIAV
jgi:hypothetical protein